MKLIHLLLLYVALSFFGVCKTTPYKKDWKPKDISTNGPIENTKVTQLKNESEYGSINGLLFDDDHEPIVYVNILFVGV